MSFTKLFTLNLELIVLKTIEINIIKNEIIKKNREISLMDIALMILSK